MTRPPTVHLQDDLEGYLKISAARFLRDEMKNHAVNIAVLGLLCVQAVLWRV